MKLIRGICGLLFCLPLIVSAGEFIAQERASRAFQAFPGQEGAMYIDIPSSGNGVSNMLLRAVIADAPWMRQLTGAMARGAQTPTYLVVGGQDNGVAYKALQTALRKLNGQKLPHLHLVLVGDPQRGGKLRSQAEALEAEYRVLVAP